MVSTTGPRRARAPRFSAGGAPTAAERSEALGGYYAFGENREREPVDGHEKIVRRLDHPAAGSAAHRLRRGDVHVMAMPQYCNRVYGPTASDHDLPRPAGLRARWAWGMGGLMAVTGAVFRVGF